MVRQLVEQDKAKCLKQTKLLTVLTFPTWPLVIKHNIHVFHYIPWALLPKALQFFIILVFFYVYYVKVLYITPNGHYGAIDIIKVLICMAHLHILCIIYPGGY